MLVGLPWLGAKCPQIQVTVVDLNEENRRMEWWRCVDNILIYEPGLLSDCREEAENLFFPQSEKAIDEAQIIFLYP
jgi:UDPglucose 6-dehydrogenase